MTHGWTYELRWRESGKGHRRSLRTQDLNGAITIRSAFEDKMRQQLGSILTGYDVTFREMIDSYIDSLESLGRSGNTIRLAKGRLSAISNHVGDRALRDVRTDILQSYFTAAIKAGRKPSGYHTDFRYLKAAYNHAIRTELTESNPTVRLVLPRIPRKIVHRLSLKEGISLIRAIESYPDRPDPVRLTHVTIAWLLMLTGMRISEALELCWDDIDLEEDVIYVTGKGGDEREVLISGLLRGKLESLPRDSALVFPGRSQDGSTIRGMISYSRLSKWFREYFRKAGIPVGRGLFHRLRHTVASILSDEGFGVDAIAHLLGHSDSGVTRVYIDHGRKQQRLLIDALDKAIQRDLS